MSSFYLKALLLFSVTYTLPIYQIDSSHAHTLYIYLYIPIYTYTLYQIDSSHAHTLYIYLYIPIYTYTYLYIPTLFTKLTAAIHTLYIFFEWLMSKDWY